MTIKEDYWADDEFEDTVARALIACFESKVKKNRGAAPADRLTPDRVNLFRGEGPYIPGPSRIFLGPDGHKTWTFDLVNDRLPVKGAYASPLSKEKAMAEPNAYLAIHFVRQATALGHCWHKRKSGTLFEMLTMQAENDGIQGERRYFTVTKNGEVAACTQKLASSRWKSGERVGTIEPDEKWLEDTAACGSLVLQALADRAHCWTITAQEKAAKAHLGCMQEEVKSLLYARSLPMSATGRKRPILHLVEAHKRRMRSGIDIDIASFLRGQQTVEIGGTVFKVNPPARLQAEVSKPSRERYFQAVA